MLLLLFWAPLGLHETSLFNTAYLARKGETRPPPSPQPNRLILVALNGPLADFYNNVL